MKVSQISHCVERDAELHIIDSSLPIDKMILFEGARKDLQRDNELNKRHVRKLFACDDIIVLDVTERNKNDTIRTSK